MRPSLWRVQFKSDERYQCRHCDASLSIVDRIPQTVSVFLLLITIPLWLVGLFIVLGFGMIPLLPREATWSIWVTVISAVTAIGWSFAGWPILVDYLTKRMELWVPTCHKCGYNLTVMSDNTCPECGTAYDPDFVPFFKRSVWAFKLTRKGLKFTIIFGISLFVLLMVASVIYQQVQGTHPLRYGWPSVIYVSGTYHGKPVDAWSNVAWLLNLAMCLGLGLIIDTIRYNIALKIKKFRQTRIKQGDES